MDNNILFGRTGADEGFKDEILLTNMSNRHGCITGATGTGKTVSLQVLAEAFSKKGVPVLPISKAIFLVLPERQSFRISCGSGWKSAIWMYPYRSPAL